MDSSNFPHVHPLHDAAREGKLGLLKFETSDPVKAFLELKAKMYCFQTLQSCKKKLRRAFAKQLYKTLHSIRTKEFYLKSVTCVRHNILLYPLIMNYLRRHPIKITLSSYFDKFMFNNIDSHSYGHFRNAH